LNGVDNGRAWFKNCRIPRDNLLDKYAQVSPEGVYTSAIKSPTVRFATMIGGLVGGRVLIAAAALDGTKFALNNAIKFSLQRKQFGQAPGKGIVLYLLSFA
jgi:acyl-CoA oxidase